MHYFHPATLNVGLGRVQTQVHSDDLEHIQCDDRTRIFLDVGRFGDVGGHEGISHVTLGVDIHSAVMVM